MRLNTRSVRVFLVAALVSTFVSVATPAHALFHLMQLTEVFAGTADQPAAQFIEMQMYADNQRFLASHEVVVYDGTGAEAGRFTFTTPVENGANQSYVLLATPEAETLFGVTADLAIDDVLTAGGGKACFMDNQGGQIDCASWGSYSGDAEGSGTPFNAPVGLVAGRSMARDTSGGENPDGLDPGDDTNDSAADFESSSPSPTNNAGNASQTEEHDRSVTLELRSRQRLVASGEVSSEFEACASDVAVKIQRKGRTGWKTLARIRTDQSGAYRTSMQMRSGTYRAATPAFSPDAGHSCLRAVSPRRKA